MGEFKVHLRRESERYYLTYDGKKITMSSLPKVIPKLTRAVLDILHNNNGKIVNEIKGRLIEFPTREDALKAGDELLGIMVSDKLFE